MNNSTQEEIIFYYLSKVKANFKTTSNIAKQRLRNPKLNVIGAYHYLNVGDMSLGKAIQNFVETNYCIHTHLLALNYYQKYSSVDLTILGGGAILQPHNIRKLLALSRGNKESTAIVGVDLHKNLPDKDLHILREIKFLSSRAYNLTNKQQQILRQEIGRNDIIFHPDLAFRLYPICSRLNNDLNISKKTIGINLLPWHFRLQGKKWISCDSSKHYFGKLSNQQGQKFLGQEYINLIKEVIRYYSDMGYLIYHLPFSVEDDLFARSVLRNSNIIFWRYSSNPLIAFKRIKKLSLFIASRLHAHIFALINKVPLVSIAYGVKCQNLFKYPQLYNQTQLTQNDFLKLQGKLKQQKDFLLGIDPILLTNEQLQCLSDEVNLALAKCIHSILN